MDYGPTSHELSDDHHFGTKHQRNLEQANRRALRSLEKRGLVRLDRYSFTADIIEERETLGPVIHSRRTDPKHHVPGESRYMTGVTLTDHGRVEAGAKREAASPEAETELRSFNPRNRELVLGVLETYPLVSLDEAIEMLKYFRGTVAIFEVARAEIGVEPLTTEKPVGPKGPTEKRIGKDGKLSLKIGICLLAAPSPPAETRDKVLTAPGHGTFGNRSQFGCKPKVCL